MSYRRIASLKDRETFLEYCHELGIEFPLVESSDKTTECLGASYDLAPWLEKSAKNRFSILPMEGWDGTPEGKPTEHTIRRWRHFGASGAALIWGGEAVAVQHDGRANPNQLLMTPDNVPALASLRETLLDEHRQRFGSDDGLVVGLQLTHSGRFAKPNDHHKPEPRVLYRHPVLDEKFGVSESLHVLTDGEIEGIIESFVAAAVASADMGFEFVDIKHCHGYLGHEFLSAHDRPGPYGGSFENRTRFLREIVAGIRAQAPDLAIGLRISAVDWIPRLEEPGHFDMVENIPNDFYKLLKELGIDLVCVSVGSPYYCPHVQRPALFPPSDGYAPPEDPLVGVARQIALVGDLKRRHQELVLVGSGYSYLQEWLADVGAGAVDSGLVDFVGIGRLVLSYPTYCDDVLSGRALARKQVCRTFSDCTTAPRAGLISGCYPLDEYYKSRPENDQVVALRPPR